MGSDRLKMPPVRDLGFHQRKKHDKWREVPAPSPALEWAVADSHAHLHMLPDPAWELVRCAANGVDLVCTVTDLTEDDVGFVLDIAEGKVGPASDAAESSSDTAADVLVAVGVHPHNARLYSDEVEQRLMQLADRDVVRAIGEIGLDYHYDFSTREEQRRVFARQIRLAQQLGLPIALHLRSGEDPVEDNAHEQAFRILEEEGFPQAGTLLHCCALGPEQLRPWIDAGCFIAYGGALTFKNADEARAGALLVPQDKLLLETDAPYMTPEPMRGAACTPAHVIFTAERLAELRGVQPGPEREAFLRQVRDNTGRFLVGAV